MDYGERRWLPLRFGGPCALSQQLVSRGCWCESVTHRAVRTSVGQGSWAHRDLRGRERRTSWASGPQIKFTQPCSSVLETEEKDLEQVRDQQLCLLDIFVGS